MTASSVWHRYALCNNCLLHLRISTRTISTFSAIGKALRESKEPSQRKTPGRISDSRQPKQPGINRSRSSIEARKEPWRTSRRLDALDKPGSRPSTRRAKDDHRNRTLPGERVTSKERRLDDRPESFWGIPYTTAASQFLFGYATVMAALKAKKRKFYKLYVHERAIRRDIRNSSDKLLKLAMESNVSVRHVTDTFLSIMDKTAKNRPHNGLILEASPLPIMPVLNLSDVSRHNSEFALELDFQSAEQKAINGTNSHVPQNSADWRNPFVLLLHEIKDEGNFGAIIRTAYFLGVDAVAIHDRATASFSSGPALKASSGAAEALPLLRVGNIDSFLTKSAEVGWQIFASVAPPAPSLRYDKAHVALTANSESPLGFSSGTLSSESSGDSINSSGLPMPLDSSNAASDDPNIFNSSSSSHNSQLVPSPLTPGAFPYNHLKHSFPLNSLITPTLYKPSILILGGEHEGLSRRVLSKSHTRVYIESMRPPDEIGVDSLNVGVAAGLLIQKFVQRPKGPVRVGIGEKVV